jgi:hypothetical protein
MLAGCGSSTPTVAKKNNVVVQLDLVNITDDKVAVSVTPPTLTETEIVYHLPKIIPGTYSVDDYGKMVVRNGYYVWRVKYPNPSFKAKIKWHLITLLLTAIRFTNVVTTSKRKEALTETFGRISGWFSLFFNPPL